MHWRANESSVDFTGSCDSYDSYKLVTFRFSYKGEVREEKGEPIYTLLAAALMNFNIYSTNPPQEVEQVVYLEKPFIAETVITPQYTAKPTGNAVIIGRSNEQCVVYARRITRNEKVHGYAGNLTSEGDTPVVGAILLEPGHVSVVREIKSDGVLVEEANYIHGAITQRLVPSGMWRGFIYS